MMKKPQKGLMSLCTLACLLAINNVQAQTKPISQYSETANDTWSVYIKGFIQTDAMLDFQKMKFKDGFRTPSILIPQENSMNSNFSVKQSQIRLSIKQTDSEGNSDLSAYVEVDFLGSNGTTAPRFRQGYLKWKNLLVGQTWSNFSDFDFFPNIIDFVGPNGSMLIRTIQVRYSIPISKKEVLSLSLEDPNTTNIFLREGNTNWTKKSIIPIMTAVYRYGNAKDYVKVGGILSPISYEIKNEALQQASNKTVLGYGGMISARLYSNEVDNIRVQSSYGKGYSSYNTVLGGEKYDAVPDLQNNRLETLKLFNILGAYEHWWASQWSSTVYYSYSELGKKDFIPENMIQNFQNLGVNLIYHPYKKLKFGTEGSYGNLSNFGRQKAEAFRLQFSSVLSF